MMRCKSILLLLAGGVLLSAAGCFPIDLHVNAQGEMLIPRQEGFFLFQARTGKLTALEHAQDGLPVFGRFSPAGTEAVLVRKVRKDFVDQFRFDLVSLKDGKSRSLFTMRDAGNVHFSPDGSQLAVIRYADAFANGLPEVHLADVKTGKVRLALAKAGNVVRWFADSKRLLVFRIQEKDKNSRYHGEIAILDAASGDVTPLAAAVTSREGCMELSPDNKTVLFGANQAGEAGALVDDEKNFDPVLFELDVAAKSIRPHGGKVSFICYSPNGKKILLLRKVEANLFDLALDRLEIVIADAELKNLRSIAADAHRPIITIGAEGLSFPGWIDDATVFYFIERRVFGIDGRALHLVVIGADGQNKRYVQPGIDLGVMKAAPQP
ncbi:MAG: hypothetical protein L0215_07820 [Gemmataceae bacterium]|nr:hypothetical protein [Gemmataceae bacterium]